MLEPVLSPDHRLLDVGSGENGLGDFLQSANVVGTDLCASAEGRNRRNFVQSSMTALPFSNQSFSAVAAIDVLEHLAPLMRDNAIAE